MSEKEIIEILCKQLQLLAEKSKEISSCEPALLPDLTAAMCKVCEEIQKF